MRKLWLLAVVACATNGSTGFEIDGSIYGSAPATSKVVIYWDLKAHGYKWGDGSGSASSFTITLADDPPPGAQFNASGLAVGFPVLVDDSVTVGDGPTDMTFQRLGIATDYAIIWRDVTGSGAGTSWESSFGARYSCAHCVRSMSGSASFDSFELTPCATETIPIGAPPQSTLCNW
jgi:hypothetical protein